MNEQEYEPAPELWNVNDKTEAACHACGDWRPATYLLRDYLLADGVTVVPKLLMLVCDSCKANVEMPHQSTARLAQAELESTMLRARVSQKLLDGLLLAAQQFHRTPEEANAPLLRNYASLVSRDEHAAARLRRLLGEEIAEGPHTMRLELRLNADLKRRMMRRFALDSTITETEVLRGLAAIAVEELYLHPQPASLARAQEILDIACT